MNRSEFLQELTKALRNDLNGSIVQENVEYYNNYIAEELKKGRSESDILSDLGDPWIIARTAIETAGNSSQSHTYEAGETTQKTQKKDERSSVHMFGLNNGWKKALVVIVIVAILFSVIGLVSGIIRLIAPIAIPIILVFLILRVFKRRS